MQRGSKEHTFRLGRLLRTGPCNLRACKHGFRSQAGAKNATREQGTYLWIGAASPHKPLHLQSLQNTQFKVRQGKKCNAGARNTGDSFVGGLFGGPSTVNGTRELVGAAGGACGVPESGTGGNGSGGSSSPCRRWCENHAQHALPTSASSVITCGLPSAPEICGGSMGLDMTYLITRSRPTGVILNIARQSPVCRRRCTTWTRTCPVVQGILGIPKIGTDQAPKYPPAVLQR